MIKQESGTLNATGADLYVGIGFVPDWVEIMSLETTDEERQYWDRNMRSTEMLGGISIDDDGTISPVTVGVGIAPYNGGDLITAASTVYIQRKRNDQRSSGTGGVITSWVNDTPASFTGHFNNPVSTTYVGEGSIVKVGAGVSGNSVTAIITALSNDGDAADEVTLYNVNGSAVSSNQVLGITAMYDYWGVAANTVMSAGFFLDSTAAVNTSGDMVRFKAGTWT